MEIGNVINVLNPTKTPALSIVDLGKKLLECAREGQTNGVHDLVCRGAPFTTDWVCHLNFSGIFSYQNLHSYVLYSWANRHFIWLPKIIILIPAKCYYGPASVRTSEQKSNGNENEIRIEKKNVKNSF